MKNLVIMLMLMLTAQFITAQQNEAPPRGKRGEKIESLRVAFITEKLQLSVDEAKQFWPVYNMYMKDLGKLGADVKQHKADAQMSDSEAEEMVKDRFSMQERRLELDRKYYQEFRKVLPATKIALFYDSVKEFNQKLLKAYKDKRPGGADRPRRRN